ncbi:MAG: 30S ribosomal protein S2 [Candidatus Latescibacteria bacterium]|nr:30S ribosomal protein S2 [Candidatus Latescibacterota bacterium]
MAEVAIRDLLEAGTHFGHQTRRWNPKMKDFIFTERNGIHIIDLQKTVRKVAEATAAVNKAVRAGRSVLFVGTKKQAIEVIKEEAERCGMFHVTERWLGGMLTNWQTITQSIKHLDYLDRIAGDGTYEQLKKKEILLLEKEKERLVKTLGGIRKMGGVPGVIFIVDPKKEHIAVREAQKLGIPSVAIVDTNCDPNEVTHPIPGNDDALRSISLIAGVIADAVLEGKAANEEEKAAKEKARQEGEAEESPAAAPQPKQETAGQ